jgi:hypothetical protein
MDNIEDSIDRNNAADRRAYHSPKLLDLGSISSLVLHGTNAGDDDGLTDCSAS